MGAVLAEPAASVLARIVAFRQVPPDPGEAPVGEPGQWLYPGELNQSAQEAVPGRGRKRLPDHPERFYPPVDPPIP